MKRAGRLFDAVNDWHTLTAAAWRAAQGKRQRPEVWAFLSRLDEETARIGRSLRDGTFRFGEYRCFAIRDPKSRTIHAPPFRDRVVHHALLAVTGPAFEKGAIRHTYACRPGRGQHAALRQARRWIRRGDWFLKVDVAKFYDTIDHEILRRRLARRFRERRLLTLFDRLFDSYHTAPDKGLPIGALTSQYLGNFMLDPLDHFINQGLHTGRYLRYMDDMLIVGNRGDLTASRDVIAEHLAVAGLAMKGSGIVNRCAEGVPFLGFVLYPNRIRLNRQGRRRLRRKYQELEREWNRGAIGETELQSRSGALFAHCRFGDDIAWRRMVTGFSRYDEFGETQEPEPGPARRLVDQLRKELPRRVSQQEQAVEPQQEQRLPALSGSQHDGHRGESPQSQPADNASSRARAHSGRDETTGKPPAPADIPFEIEPEKADTGAPTFREEEGDRHG